MVKLSELPVKDWKGKIVAVYGKVRGSERIHQFDGEVIGYPMNNPNRRSYTRALVMPLPRNANVKPKWIEIDRIEVLS